MIGTFPNNITCTTTSECNRGKLCTEVIGESSFYCIEASAVHDCGNPEQCDIGISTAYDSNHGCIGADEICLPNTCQCVLGVCGDGILEAYGPDGMIGTDDDEQCDDGNDIDDDGCSATCKLESPLDVPEVFSGYCIDNRLPAINSDEVLPIRWQTQYVSGVTTGDSSCPDVDHLASDNWILSANMTCDLGVYRYEGTGLLQIRSGSVACGNGASPV